MKNHTEDKEINRIEKRAIEALAIAPVIRAVSQRIGQNEALAILQEVNQQEALRFSVLPGRQVTGDKFRQAKSLKGSLISTQQTRLR